MTTISVTDRFIMFVLKTAGGKIQRTELSTITELSDETIRHAENRLIFDNRIRKITKLTEQGVRVFYEVIA